MKCKTFARLTVAAAFGAAVVSGMPTLAYADTSSELQSKLNEANAHLDDLYSQASDLGQQLLQTQEDLDATTSEIEQKQGELSNAQDVLASRVASNYKTGGVSLLSIIFDANSFDDMVNRIFYASKVSESDAQTIQQVKDIQAELDTKQSEQQQLLADQQSQKDEIDAKTSEAESYVSSLDQQVQDKLAEEQAAAKAQQEQAAAEAQAQAATNGGYVTAEDLASNGGSTNAASGGTTADNGSAPSQNTSNGSANTNANTNTNNNSNGGSSTNTTPSSPSKPSSGGSSSSGSGSSSSSSSGLTQSQRDAIVSAAWSKVGGPYVYGGTGPVGYDCSGFVQYCYAQAGISLPRTSGAQGGWGVSTSNPQPGDIICWGGHVGIYISRGMMIDAGNERVGISYRAIYGSPWYQTKG